MQFLLTISRSKTSALKGVGGLHENFFEIDFVVGVVVSDREE